MGVSAHLEQLKSKHANIETMLKAELKHANPDTVKIAELKKQKLHLKDQIESYAT